MTNNLRVVLKLECLSDRHWRNRRLAKLIYSNSGVPSRATKKGSDIYYHPWVANVEISESGLITSRNFIKGTKDYSDANSSGIKGVYMYFFLENNKLYQVCEHISFIEKEKYLIKIESGEFERIDHMEAVKWSRKV